MISVAQLASDTPTLEFNEFVSIVGTCAAFTDWRKLRPTTKSAKGVARRLEMRGLVALRHVSNAVATP
eukprot:4736252-Lingulodinium_polyedra.AAC.1